MWVKKKVHKAVGLSYSVLHLGHKGDNEEFFANLERCRLVHRLQQTFLMENKQDNMNENRRIFEKMRNENVKNERLTT